MPFIMAGVLDSLSPPRRRLLLAAAGVLVAGAVAGGVAAAGRGTTAAVSQSDPGPVFLVPGYGGATGGLESLAAVLRQQGRTVTVVTVPDHGYADLEVQATALATAVGAASGVDVVGYSDGGVVARTWVRDHGGAAKARRVITLSSPHHGTDLAGLGGNLGAGSCPTACQQVQPDSAFLNRLNAGDETPPGPAYVSIWTTNDSVVSPPTSARLAGALDLVVQQFCPADPVDHAGMPTDPVVRQIVAQELSAAPVHQPTVSCSRPSS